MPLDFFSRTPLPESLPEDMRIVAEQLKQSVSQKICLFNAYTILTEKYHGERLKTYTCLSDIFLRDIAVLWHKNGFLHCTNINYLLRVLLVKSGFFTESDIRLRWTHIWYISPHQYLQAKVGTEWIDVDVWAYAYGIRLGDKAHGFHGTLPR